MVLALWVSGCRTRAPRTAADTDFSYAQYFTEPAPRLLFKSRIRLSKEAFSGLLVVKRTAEGEYRSIFTTETGFKLFDFTVTDSGYTVNYGVGPIAKKFISVRLAYTVQAFLLRPLGHYPSSPAEGDGSTFRAGKYGYELRKQDNRVSEQTVSFKGRDKATSRFFDFGAGGVPDSASVSHSGFPLTASFRILKQ